MSIPLRLLLIANFAYCAMSAVIHTLPSWRMFERVERIDYLLTDAKGRAISISEVLPSGTMVTTLQHLLPIVSFICEHRPADRPLQFREFSRNIQFTLGTHDCKTPPTP